MHAVDMHSEVVGLNGLGYPSAAVYAPSCTQGGTDAKRR